MFIRGSRLIATVAIFLTAQFLHATTDCFSTIVGTKGPNAISYCITANGNIQQITGEGLKQQGSFEGYEVLVHNPFTGDVDSLYDYGVSGVGFGAPVIVQPNGPNTFPLKITRTVDQAHYNFGLTLEQTFHKDGLDPSVVLVDMKVTFFADWPRLGINVTRATDVTADQDPAGTIKVSGSRSVLASKPGGHGLGLSALSLVDDFTSSYGDACDFAHHLPPASGVPACASYDILLPHHEWNLRSCCNAFGASRKVTFEYKLF